MKNIVKTRDQLGRELKLLSASLNVHNLEIEQAKHKIDSLKEEQKEQLQIIKEKDKEVKNAKARAKTANEKAGKEEAVANGLGSKNQVLQKEIEENVVLLNSIKTAIDKEKVELAKIKDNNIAEALKGSERLLDVCGQLQESANNLKKA